MNIVSAVVFVAMHPLPAEHFIVFADSLGQNGVQTHMVVGGVAKEKIATLGIEFTDIDVILGNRKIEALSEDERKIFFHNVAKACDSDKVIFIGIGYGFSAHFLDAITELYGDSKRVILYYDNSEGYVPGEYSDAVEKTISERRPKELLFANRNLATGILECTGEGGVKKPINLSGIKRRGLGYYPMKDTEELKEKRGQNESLRESFFAKNGLEDKGEDIMVYLGGASIPYVEQAFPAFCNMLSEMEFNAKPAILIFRNHPRSDKFGKKDWLALQKLEKPGLRIVLDNGQLLDTLAIANHVLYYQTSLSPLLVLARTNPIQVAHSPYNEILTIKGLIPIATEVSELERCLNKTSAAVEDSLVYDAIGYDPDWEKGLLMLLREGI